MVVKDQDGAIIGTAVLEDGLPTTGVMSTCVFKFTVADLLEAAFYSVEVAQRDPVMYSRDELEAASWKVELAVGG